MTRISLIDPLVEAFELITLFALTIDIENSLTSEYNFSTDSALELLSTKNIPFSLRFINYFLYFKSCLNIF